MKNELKKEIKSISFEIKVSGSEERTIDILASDDSVDSYNEILTHDGWDLKRYKKNPVIIWAHNYSIPPIAKTIWMKADKEKGLLGRIKFPDEGVNPFADTIFKMYKDKFLNAFSVGFYGNERVVPKKPGEPILITKKELLEISAVPIPSNPNALQKNAFKSALEKGIINEQEYQEVLLQAKVYLQSIEIKAPEESITEFTITEELKVNTVKTEKPKEEPAKQPEGIPEDVMKKFMSMGQSAPIEGLDEKTVDEFKNMFKHN
jgi:HK97 family phage prohead protease